MIQATDDSRAAAIEAELVAAPTAAANAEYRALLRAVEREMVLGLARPCAGCGQWVSLWIWANPAGHCPNCLVHPKGSRS